MKLRVAVLLSALWILIFMLPSFAVAKDLVVKQPPASLDKLYPPASDKPQWIQMMHKMSTNFGGFDGDGFPRRRVERSRESRPHQEAARSDFPCQGRVFRIVSASEVMWSRFTRALHAAAGESGKVIIAARGYESRELDAQQVPIDFGAVFLAPKNR